MNVFDQIPPSAPDIERVVLSSFLSSPDVFSKYSYQIKPDYFYNSDHKKYFEYMSKNNCTDVLILSNIFPDDIEKITEIAESYSANLYLEQEIFILKDHWERREIIRIASENMTAAFSDFDSRAGAIIEKTIGDLNGTSSYESKPEIISESLPRIFDMFEKISKAGTAIGLKTGVKDIDELIGGFIDQEMIIIAGAPSMGKTALALQIARHNAIEEKIPVLIFSIETSIDQINGRILCSHAGINYDSVLRGVLPLREWPLLSMAAGPVSEAPIYTDETAAIPIMQLYAKAENYVKNNGVKLIITDHIGLISGEEKGRSRNEELGKISKRIKALGKALKIPTITLCQLSREVSKRQPPIPRLSDLYESGSLEQDADKVIFLYREEYYNRNSEKKNIVEIILAKNKNGRVGFKELFFDLPTMNFKNLSREIEVGKVWGNE